MFREVSSMTRYGNRMSAIETEGRSVTDNKNGLIKPNTDDDRESDGCDQKLVLF